MSDPSVIVAGARTPFGRFLGGLAGLSAADLGAVAIRGALDRSTVAPDLVDYLVMGQVLQAGAGQNPARTAGLAAGLPGSVPSVTVNKVCLSGLTAIAQADQLIRAGEATVVVAGGMESMSQAPHLLRGRRGLGFGDAALVDALVFDALRDQATGLSMGALTEAWYASHPQLTRAEQDAYAASSHERAARAQETGIFDAEIVPVTVPQRRGHPRVVTADEGVRRDTTVEALGELPPAFTPDGTITAGSASQLSDGAAAVVCMARATAVQLGLSWLVEIGAYGTVAGPDSSFVLQPAAAAARALAREGLTAAGLDVVEISEAFAAVALESSRALGVTGEKVNVNGGAIALGHPLGASGTRMILHLALELRRRAGGTGVATLCGGGGQGDALVLRAPSPGAAVT